ncbi:MAG: MipA/OmpV family protein [Gammaproteobacteria bacterium]|nr:MipA/OmpV family protein [Gammaproteobacteria bacterium]
MKMLHNTTIITTTIAVVAIIITSTPVFSQESGDDLHTKSFGLGIGFPSNSQALQAQIGLGIGSFPEYEGSDDYAAIVLPLINIRQQGSYFIKGASINTNDGLGSAGLTFLHFSYSEESRHRMQIVMGPLIRAYGKRDENASNVLKGLGDIDRSIGIGGFIEFTAGDWLANLSLSPQDVGNENDGTLATFDIAYTASINDGLKLSTGLSTSWADDDYMQGYFGVTDDQAIQSGLSGFDSKSGFKDVGLQVKASYSVSPRWSLEGQVGYWRLLNDAADSPIVKDEGSADQVRGLVGLSYHY